MILTVIEATCCASITLPDKAEGQYVLSRPSDNTPLFTLRGTEQGWCLLEEEAKMISAPPDHLQGGMLLRAMCRKDYANIMVLVEEKTADRQCFSRFLVSENTTLTVGSAPENDLVLSGMGLAPRQMSLIYAGGTWRVQMEHGGVFAYVNGRRFNGGVLQPGDALWILGQIFIMLPDILCCNRPGKHLSLNTRKLTVLQPPQIDKTEYYKEASPVPTFNRMPRFSSMVDREKLNIDAPPGQQTTQQQSPLLQMGPALTSGLFALLGGMSSLMTVGMMASNLIFPTISRRKATERQEAYEQRRQKEYKAYINSLEAQLQGIATKQLKTLEKLLPPPAEMARQLLQDSKHLWDRRKEQEDCLQIRIGTGELPLQCDITLPQQHFDLSDDPLRALLNDLREKKYMLKPAPLAINLEKHRIVGVAGMPQETAAMAAQMLFQLSTQVGYDELKICLVGRPPKSLRPFCRLPHTWSDDQSHHLIAWNDRELLELIQNLDPMLAERQENQSSSTQDKKPDELVIFILDERIAQRGMVSRLLFENKYRGVHIVSLARHTSGLPRQCDLVLGVNGRMGILKGLTDEKLQFTLDENIAPWANQAVHLMENARLDMADTASRLPKAVPFLQLFHAETVEDMNILSRWKRCDPSRSLSAPIGIDEDGELCYLDLHQLAHGPHGLIAGMTGSGKSELIATYILSMAVSYSPEEVAFALIDYKGGGTATVFRTLPHVAGVITNLDGSSVQRALISIQSELKRRQRLFQETGMRLNSSITDIYEYQRCYRSKQVQEPLPHLLIIVDEFAELKTQQPDFMKELDSAARLGRSLGIHLILATQKPSGVVDDQIWSNTNFRLCMRVQDPRDSQDMLKRPDAAYLTGVGRFYLQAGYSGVLTKAQSGWTGAPYSPMATAMASCAVEVIDRTGYVLRHMTIQRGADSSMAKTQLQVVLGKVKDAAHRADKRARPLWLPPLETEPLEALHQRYAVQTLPWELTAMIGEADHPAGQCRLPVELPLSSGRSTLIYGALGSGKAMVLNAMLQDLMNRHSPKELHIYILDYLNEGFASLKDAPHVGDVIGENDTEKLDRLFHMLEDEIRQRKLSLSGSLTGSSVAQRLQKAGLPAILVVIHQLAALQDQQMDRKEQLVQLISAGPPCGVNFVATMPSANGLSYQVSQQFAQQVVLQMPHDDDYSMILGRVGSLRPASERGRGIVRLDKQLYEFQTASVQDNLAAFCAKMSEQWPGEKVPPIAVMPQRLEAEALLPYLDSSHPLCLPIALDVDSLAPCILDFSKQMVQQVIGFAEDVAPFALSIGQLGAKQGLDVTILDATACLPQQQCLRIVLPEKAEAYVDELFSWRIQAQKAESESNDRHKLLILTDAAMTLQQLNGKTKYGEDGAQSSYGEILRALMERVKSSWRMSFLVCASAQGIQKLKGESWYGVQLTSSNGMLFGGAITQQYVLEVYKAQNHPGAHFPMGYILKNGLAQYVRFAAEGVEL